MKKLVIMAIATIFFNLIAQAQVDKVSNHTEWKPGTTALKSLDGRYRLDYQADGNLVLYKKNFNNEGIVAIWAVAKDGKTPKMLAFQADGNLVCYGFNPNVVWASNSNNKGGKTLVLQNDGNLVIYTAQNTPIWSTGTFERNKGCN